MLKQLYIKNYALIDELNLVLKPGLTMITGETGAGKSILLGALGMLEGKRADSSVLHNADEKCIIEGVFDLSKYKLKSFFEDQELDYEPGQTQIRREISNAGKSRAFINDTPVSLDVLKKLSFQLIDIHSQHDHLLIQSPEFQLNFIDQYSKAGKSLQAYQNLFQTYKVELKKYHDFLHQKESQGRDVDYMTFLLEELQRINPQENEIDLLEQELEVLEKSEMIKEKLNHTYQLLQEDRQGVLHRLKQIRQDLGSLPSSLQEQDRLFSRIDSAYIDLQDISSLLEQINENTIYEPKIIEEKRQRLDQLHFLLKKHHVLEIKDLLRLKAEYSEKLHLIINSDDILTGLEKNVQKIKKELTTLADQVSKIRISSFKKIETALKQVFQELNMPNAELSIVHSLSDDFMNTGRDLINFKIKTNKGADFKDINKAASGGELSRIMLAVKYSMAQNTTMPTLIFDEIDTGVSGETAHKLGTLLEQLAKDSQVLVITHLPQVASKGKQHYQVFKDTKKDKTHTQVKLLSNTERVEEIAKLLSTGKMTPTALKNAQEMLKTSK